MCPRIYLAQEVLSEGDKINEMIEYQGNTLKSYLENFIFSDCQKKEIQSFPDVLRSF